jgi:ABC-type antimicrobial peptide transport system permease subunit
VAVLRALGITRRQSRLIVLTQATTLAAVGLAFGVPLGVALGRTVWRTVAESTPVLYIPPVPPLALALAVPVALGVGVLLATLPARRAARIRVGDTLRAE